MRRRLTIAVVGTVAVALLLASIVTLALVRRADRQATQKALEQEATVLAGLIDEIPFDEQDPGSLMFEAQNPDSLMLRLAGELQHTDGTVLVMKDNAILGEFPEEVRSQDIYKAAQADKKSASGISGSTAWAVAVGKGSGAYDTTVVLTDDANRFVGSVLRWLVVSASVSLALGAVVAAVVSRRMSAPMRRARDATRLIAGGDLGARVPVDERRQDEINDLSASINEMAESLERSQSLERQFLMSISHDLRTPLTSIRGYGEAIADGTAEDREASAEIIVSAATQLERLVSDLLDLARLNARQFTLENRLVDVGAVAEEVCAGFAQSAADRGVELRIAGQDEAPEQTVTAWCDPGRLAQVIANLVQNALKFADSLVQVECRVESRADQIWTTVSVADDGPGISPEDRPHVFKRLYQARHAPQPKEAGSGLGLAIVAELAEAMGGSVSIAARHPAGTQFAVELPAREP